MYLFVLFTILDLIIFIVVPRPSKLPAAPMVQPAASDSYLSSLLPQMLGPVTWPGNRGYKWVDDSSLYYMILTAIYHPSSFHCLAPVTRELSPRNYCPNVNG